MLSAFFFSLALFYYRPKKDNLTENKVPQPDKIDQNAKSNQQINN